MSAWVGARRVRLAVARVVDQTRVWCWASLVTWAMYPQVGRWEGARKCRREAAECGLCYCGRFMDAERLAAVLAAEIEGKSPAAAGSTRGCAGEVTG